MLKISQRTQHLQQSGIRKASIECNRLGGINLGQGVCDLPIPDAIKQAAYTAIAQNKNIYGPCEGIFELRQAVAKKFQEFNHIKANPEKEIMITTGSTGAFVSAAMTLFEPGDEVILFEPFYGYHKNVLNLYQITTKAVSINMNDFSIDIQELKNAMGPKTRGIVICTPCNPCGKVFSEQELLAIGEIAEKYNLVVITDEIYEYITYPGFQHISFASLKDFQQRTITISGFSKTYNMTGWRLGYVTGPQHVIEKMSLVHDLLYICPASPLQYAVLAAFSLDAEYFKIMRQLYLEKRDLVVASLRAQGFTLTVPQGAYYVMADFKQLKFTDDEAATQHILQNAKVATVPGRSFYENPLHGKTLLRVCYALSKESVSQALQQMQEIFVR